MTPPQPPDRIATGIAIIVASVAAMSFGDAVIKHFSASLTLWQIFVARSLFAIPCLLVLAFARGLRLHGLFRGRVVLRSVLLVLSWIAFYAALPVLDLSVAAVAAYTNPILTALMAAAVLRERVTGRQWLGVLLGFAGVTMILRPGSEAFSWAVLLPLLAAALYSASMILTRSRCRGDDAILLALGLHGMFVVTGLVATLVLGVTGPVDDYPFLLGSWTPMGRAEWGSMAVLGVLSAGFFFGVAKAYQIAPPSMIGTFDYAYLIFATLWGFVFFAEWPDGATALGMVLITGAGLLVAGRRKS